jgi:hypothetical protein
VQIEDPEPPPVEQGAADQRGSEHRDDVRLQPIGQGDDLRMVDVRHFDEQVFSDQHGRGRTEEKVRLAAFEVAAPVAQPPPGLAPKVVGP